LFPFAGGIFPSLDLGNLFGGLFRGLAEPDDCAIAGQASSAASATRRRELRIMPASIAGGGTALPDEFDTGEIAAAPDHLALMPGTCIAREG
jgi:ethanolamine utilization protein EutA (predicted chaperonin)